ncbi:hypothetical protein DYB25_003672 [Aphanomyces astaci]|uniref:Uncharacterized protein n=1 Tax=Aphanomyces astaci TaxID=112090 RepID=A0A397B6M2_APHAT|nr:hypothetical protein DYB25_003672 [Aphanomyces astaci]
MVLMMVLRVIRLPIAIMQAWIYSAVAHSLLVGVEGAVTKAPVWSASTTSESLTGDVIDYPGGWILPQRNQCVDICTKSSPTPTCFVNTTDCIDKKQEPGDYDTLILEQIFLPQYCRDLLDGIDSTVAHRPVAPYPRGIRCLAPVRSILSIHGLWPNYDGGYPSCCNVSSVIRNNPFDPLAFRAQHPRLVRSMTERWSDPTQPRDDALCELWNHEFQKHGLCYASAGEDFNTAAARYFTAAMAVADTVGAATSQIHAWAATESAIVSGADIAQLYRRGVQIDCTNGQLARIRTCWAKDSSQVDCPAPGSCNLAASIRLDAYAPPHPFE